MATEWRVARARLRELIQENLQIGHEEAALWLGYSITRVYKRRKRFNENRINETVASSTKAYPHQVPVVVKERIVALRLSLTEHYNRKVGPRTIATYLKRKKDFLPDPVPTSSATIWWILRRRQYILPPAHEQKLLFERPDPGLDWEIDYCTATNSGPEAPEKQRNALEVFNVVDRGDSSCISGHAATNFDAENTLLEMTTTIQKNGIPRCVICDRDPRLVGSQSADKITRRLFCAFWPVLVVPSILFCLVVPILTIGRCRSILHCIQ